jgi:hypothetical protein
VFTVRYELSPYIKQIRFVFKGLIYVVDGAECLCSDLGRFIPGKGVSYIHMVGPRISLQAVVRRKTFAYRRNRSHVYSVNCTCCHYDWGTRQLAGMVTVTQTFLRHSIIICLLKKLSCFLAKVIFTLLISLDSVACLPPARLRISWFKHLFLVDDECKLYSSKLGNFLSFCGMLNPNVLFRMLFLKVSQLVFTHGVRQNFKIVCGWVIEIEGRYFVRVTVF